MSINHIEEFIQGLATHYLKVLPRLLYIARTTRPKTYLEIGVRDGSTFLNFGIPYKVGVDPEYTFDWKATENDRTFLFPLESDNFFSLLAGSGQDDRKNRMLEAWPYEKPNFDLIFIDGMHTFEQSLKDFENSLAFANENTVWILDDTVPSSPYSALKNCDWSMKLRKRAGFTSQEWHGDVYKTVLAIHDLHPEFSYCTLMGLNPQTVIWRAKNRPGKPAFSSIKEINSLSYFDMLANAHLFVPVPDTEFPLLFGKTVNPENYKTENIWERLIYVNQTDYTLLPID